MWLLSALAEPRAVSFLMSSARDALVAEIVQLGHFPNRTRDYALYQRFQKLDQKDLTPQQRRQLQALGSASQPASAAARDELVAEIVQLDHLSDRTEDYATGATRS